MHFTYASAGVDLEQGDLLYRTAALNAVITDVHAYYNKADYTNFLVLTQSCDLVRRGDTPPHAHYINLAAVRPLTVVLAKEAARFRRHRLLQRIEANNLSSRQFVKQFLERLLNNNNHEYFYLHEEPFLNITDRSCAFLRLSIAVRATDHYATCLAARTASLKEPFQAKLGWLVGNVFSRVGTEDWVPANKTQIEWDELIKRILDESIDWLDDAQVKAAVKEFSPEEIEGMPRDDVLNRIRKTAVKSRKEQVIEEVILQVVHGEFLNPQQSEKLKKRLRNSPVLATLLK